MTDEHQVCIYHDEATSPQIMAWPRSSCGFPVTTYGQCNQPPMREACAPSMFTPAPYVSSSPSAKSSSAEYEDSVYEEDWIIKQAPRLTTMIDPLPAILSSREQEHYNLLTGILHEARLYASTWPTPYTWIVMSQDSLELEPLPLDLALLAQSLRYDCPSGIVVFYLDYQRTQHVRAGNTTNHTDPLRGIQLLRKHGLSACGVYFWQGSVGILEVLTWPTQTRRTPEYLQLVSRGIKHIQEYKDMTTCEP